MNTTKITLEFKEIDPSLMISDKIWDDNGQVIGRKSANEMAVQREKLTGKLKVRCLLTDVDKQASAGRR